MSNRKDLYALSVTDPTVRDVIVDTNLDHQKATRILNQTFDALGWELRTSRASVRRARDKYGVKSPLSRSVSDATPGVSDAFSVETVDEKPSLFRRIVGRLFGARNR